MSEHAPGSEHATPPAPDDPYAALRLPNYRFYVLSTVIGVIGTQIQSLAVAWEIYERTKDPMGLAYIGLARALPFFMFGLIAGQMADWFNRKVLLIVSQFTSMCCALAIAVLSYNDAPLWTFYAVLFLRASAGTLGMPARQAMLPQIVPQSVFTNAITWNSGSFHLALVIGPAIGGLVLASGPLYCYLIDACGMLLAVFFMLFVKVRHVALSREPLSLSGFLAGASFVWNTKIMLATLSLDLFAVLLGGATALLPIYASPEFLNCGPEGLGWLRAAPAVGSCIMALLLVYMPPMKHAGRTLLWMVAGFGAATVGFGISRNFWFSLSMLFLTGVFDQVRSPAGQNFRREQHLHRRVEPVGRTRIRPRGQAGRRGLLRRQRRHRHDACRSRHRDQVSASRGDRQIGRRQTGQRRTGQG